MSIVKVEIKPCKNYRNEVTVDGKFIYESGLHPIVELDKLTKLIRAIGVDNVEVTIKE